MNDLAKRLRDRDICPSQFTSQQDLLCVEAADRIEALTAERDAADALIAATFADAAENNIRLAELSHRVAELEGALRDMVQGELKWREQGTTCLITHPTEVIRAARAVLNMKGDDNG